ncbi:MAG: hypothetical protein ABWK53_05275 [Anaerolineales bacterium]
MVSAIFGKSEETPAHAQAVIFGFGKITRLVFIEKAPRGFRVGGSDNVTRLKGRKFGKLHRSPDFGGAPLDNHVRQAAQGVLGSIHFREEMEGRQAQGM